MSGGQLEGGSWNETLSDVGEFRFEGVPEGTRVRVEVRPVLDDRDDFRYAYVDDVPAGREDLVLVVEPAGRMAFGLKLRHNFPRRGPNRSDGR